MASSLSESFHASIIIHQQMHEAEEENRLRQRLQGLSLTSYNGPEMAKRHNLHKEENDKGINLCLQLLLVASLVSVEILATVGQIYEILLLQFFGVPTNLISMGGVIAGIISLILVPIIGWFADSGSNPLIRKLMMMCVLLVAVLTSAVCLAASGFMKMSSLDEILRNLEKENNISSPNPTNGMATFSPQSTPNDSNFTIYGYSSVNINFSSIATISPPLTPHQASPIRIVVALVAFALVGVGFDTGMLSCRAFILECVAPFQHTRILVLGTLLQSISGTAFALISTTNISEFLGNLFGIDGTVALVIFLSVYISFTTVLGFGCTIITGILITRRYKKSSHSVIDIKSTEANDTHDDDVSKRFAISRMKRSRLDTRNKFGIASSSEEKEIRRPLINEDNSKTGGYTSAHERYRFGESLRGKVIEEKVKEGKNGNNEGFESTDKYHTNSITFDNKDNESPGQILPNVCTLDKSQSSCIDSQEDVSDEHAQSYDEYYDSETKEESKLDELSNAVMDVLVASYSLSMVSVQLSGKKDFRTITGGPMGKRWGHEVTPETKPAPKTNVILSKRFVIFVCSVFLSFGATLTACIYSSNALTLGIYHGDPLALPGTEGNILYTKGIRQSAWGIVTMYVSFVIASILTKKMIDFVGEQCLYVSFHAGLAACLIALLMMKMEELYFLAMAVAGLQRMASYTLPYIIGAKIVQEQEVRKGVAHSSNNTGKVMAVIGVHLPLHYLLISSCMGPLISATGDPWVPIEYCLVATSGALLIFVMLYIFRRP